MEFFKDIKGDATLVNIINSAKVTPLSDLIDSYHLVTKPIKLKEDNYIEAEGILEEGSTLSSEEVIKRYRTSLFPTDIADTIKKCMVYGGTLQGQMNYNMMYSYLKEYLTTIYHLREVSSIQENIDYAGILSELIDAKLVVVELFKDDITEKEPTEPDNYYLIIRLNTAFILGVAEMKDCIKELYLTGSVDKLTPMFVTGLKHDYALIDKMPLESIMLYDTKTYRLLKERRTYLEYLQNMIVLQQFKSIRLDKEIIEIL